jgi:hypothetical protein
VNKRLAIGLSSIAIAAILFGVLSVPEAGSLRWHEREFSRIVREMEGRTLSQRASALWGKITGRPVRRLRFHEYEQFQKRLEEHRRAPVKAGHFIERRFTVTNRDARVLEALMARSSKTNMPREQTYYTWFVGARGPDTLIVCGRREDMPFWEDAIGKADVPASK